MKNSKKAQTALEYLLLIVISIIVVSAIFTWVSLTQKDIESTGNEQLEILFNATGGSPCTDRGYSCYAIAACPLGVGSYPIGNLECSPDVCCDTVQLLDSGQIYFTIDETYAGGPTEYDRAYCNNDVVLNSCPSACPGGDCSAYNNYVLKFTSGTFSGQSFLIQNVIPYSVSPVYQFVLLGFDDPLIPTPWPDEVGYRGVGLPYWDFEIYGPPPPP